MKIGKSVEKFAVVALDGSRLTVQSIPPRTPDPGRSVTSR